LPRVGAGFPRILFFWGVAAGEQGNRESVDGVRRLSKNRSMPNPAIEIENLSKEYPYGFLNLKKRRSLEDLSMQVQTGEVFGFLGPNGAGKTTAIHLAMGFMRPTHGSGRL
jgi:ABC-type glutathione transport system ATPase component